RLFCINPDNGKVYLSAAKDSPLERGLYAVDLKGKTLKSITQNKGYHAVRGVSGLKYFIDNFSTLNSVPVISLIDYEGKTVRVLENNSVLKSNMEKYSLGEVKLMKVPGADAELNAYMMTPPNFDKNKKYPVLMFQYSGPGSQQVANKFGLGYYFWHQMLAQKGYIIFCVDGTGTGFRGAEFKKKTYLTLGDKESDDQIAVAKYLSEKSFVDA